MHTIVFGHTYEERYAIIGSFESMFPEHEELRYVVCRLAGGCIRAVPLSAGHDHDGDIALHHGTHPGQRPAIGQKHLLARCQWRGAYPAAAVNDAPTDAASKPLRYACAPV